MKESIAIIGSGIAGMSAAYYLRNHFDVTLIEKNNYIGGHTNTINIHEGKKEIPIDTGFMVFNETTYPNLVRLFNELDVKTYDTSMSFGVNNKDQNLEYSSQGFSGYFAQRSNLLNTKHWALYRDIKRFFNAADNYLLSYRNTNESLAEFSRFYKLSPSVMRDFVLPMAGAIWSTPPEGIQQFPAYPLLRFMHNHRMLGIGIQLQWKTVEGGSEQYKKKLLRKLPTPPRTNQSIRSVEQRFSSVAVHFDDDTSETYDYAILATHADQALSLISHPTLQQKALLSSFKYNKNTVVLHSDDSVMPKNKRAWASWNVEHQTSPSGISHSSTHYWMNSLQNLNTEKNYFVSIDHPTPIPEDKVAFSTTYHHPLFDLPAIQSQKSLYKLNPVSRLRFCGSYFRNGFHEDALWSSLHLVHNFLKEKGIPSELTPL